MTVSKCCVFRFSDIEVREDEFSATRAGQALEIEPKAFRVLVYLVRHAGHLVTKDELIQAVWGETAVTDNSLTRAVALLRRVLDDNARQPRFIETVSTAGYRFICSVETDDESLRPSAAALMDHSAPAEFSSTNRIDAAAIPATKTGRRGWLWPMAVAGAAILLAFAAGLFWYLRRPLPPPRISSYVQLTDDGRTKEIIGTDGNNLYLNLSGPAGQATVPVSGGRLMDLRLDLPTMTDSPGDNPNMLSMAPDASALLVGSNWDWDRGWKLWVMGTHGSTARYLAQGEIGTWSPDSKTVVYMTRRGDLYTIPAEGGQPRLLYTSPTPKLEMRWAGDIAWSPDGGRIRFVRWGRYWEVAADGTHAHEVLPGWQSAKPKALMWQGHWTPDGAFFVFTADSSSTNFVAIWALDERRAWPHRPNPEPVQLTTGATHWGQEGFAISKDGRKLYTTGGVTARAELLTYDSRSKELTPYLGGIGAGDVDFSRDGKHLVYVSDGVLWRANRDGTGLMQLTRLPLGVSGPRWSPDGAQILFAGQVPFEFAKLYTISSQGGTPKRLFPEDADWESDPDWSPDGKKVVFEHWKAGLSIQRPRIMEIATGKIVDPPAESKVVWASRWSPDGRYILGSNGQDLALYDLERNQWALINPGRGVFNCNRPAWSRDGRFVYFENLDGDFVRVSDPGVYRIRVTGAKLEKVVDLKGFTFFELPWFGLDPDDNPLLVRSAGTQEIYALTLERK